MIRADFAQLHRVVIKIGSSTLTGRAGDQLDASAIERLVTVISQLRARNVDVLLVSSGAIAAGMAPLGLTTRPKDLATQQAAAAVGQGLLIAQYTKNFAEHQIVAAQVLLTIDDVVRRSHYLNAQRTLTRLLALGVIPIINENDSVGTQEIRFGDNDRIAALVANVINAELLVLVTDVDGLYDAPPTHIGARRIAEVPSILEIDDSTIGGVGSSGVGSGGMATKIDAARIATGAGVGMLLLTLSDLAAGLAGEDVGTFFHPVAQRKSSRLLWLQHAATPRGRLILDQGAVLALKERGVSLLPAGVTAVTGEFSAGESVEIADETGVVFARGICAYDSHEIPQMLGRSTKELARDLGPEFERELVHRDDLVIL